MSSINKTPNYNLSQFGDSPDDKPSWRGDYTADMSKIDAQMFRNATDATNALNTANGIKSTAENALKLAQSNEDKVAEQASYFTALGVTSEPTAQAFMNTINGKAENTALTALQGTVFSLSSKVDGKADASQVYTKAQADTTFTEQGGYSGTAQSIMNEAASASQTAAEASTKLNEIITQGVAPLAIIPNTRVLSQYMNDAYVNAWYSPISKMVNITLRFGNEDGSKPSTVTSAVNDNKQLVQIPENYRPTVFMNSPNFNFGTTTNCNYSFDPSTGYLTFYPSSGILKGQALKQTIALSYFVID